MKKNSAESKSLRFLYDTAIGRIILRVLISRTISKLAGAYLDSRFSKSLIKGFVKKNNIDLAEYESDNFKCFNDCFSRKIKEGKRPFSDKRGDLCSPCDSLLSAYRIENGTVLAIKQSRYTVESLLKDKELAERYKDGTCLVLRLCVHHYHRYAYFDNGTKGENVFIKGKLHTVRPIAMEHYPVFVENCREYTVIDTENFGTAVQMEVGAMLVGKIKNHHGAKKVCRGEEKGTFLYGGSTIVLLFEKDKVYISKELFEKTDDGVETPVKMGEVIGKASML